MTDYFSNKDMAVITSRFVLYDKSPILYVFHDAKDGMWEFYGIEELKTKYDYKIISIEEILKLDSSIGVLKTMLPGCFATRESKNTPWDIEQYIEQETSKQQ